MASIITVTEHTTVSGNTLSMALHVNGEVYEACCSWLTGSMYSNEAAIFNELVDRIKTDNPNSKLSYKGGWL